MQTKLTKLVVAATLVFTGGCAMTQQAGNNGSEDIAVLAAELDNRLAEVAYREAELKRREELTVAGKEPVISMPNVNAGECYAPVLEPATYKTVTDRILVKEASFTIKVTPATYEMVDVAIDIPASSQVITTPATYDTVKERQVVRQAESTWQTGLGKRSAGVTQELLAFARSQGAKLDSAKLGTCFHEHTVPASYELKTQKVLVSEARTDTVEVPATYKTTVKTVAITAASEKTVEVPAVYKTVKEKVLVKPAHRAWKRGSGPIQKIDKVTGEIMCLVDVPAEYKIVTKRLIVSAATTKLITIPAKTKTITDKVLLAAATTKTVTIPAKYNAVKSRVQTAGGGVIWHGADQKPHVQATLTGQKVCLIERPAEYKTLSKQVVKVAASTQTLAIPAQVEVVKVRRMTRPAVEKRTEVPAVYKTVKRQELVTDGHMVWRSILCDTNMTKSRVIQIQKALLKRGFKPGSIDGVVGRSTIKAVNAFQRANKLPVDKYLNVETIKALGVSVR